LNRVSKHGKQTGEFGRWLYEYLRNSSRYRDLAVFYDHGDKLEDPNVAAIKGFFGSRVTQSNRLADIDVMVASPDKEAILLIEIEEGQASPKKLLGDVFAILFCNQLAVKVGNRQEYYTICPETRLLIASASSSQSGRVEKIDKVIRPRLQQFAGAEDAIRAKNIEFIFGEDVPATVRVLSKKVESIFPGK
jgi:hypothetical protein